MELINARPKKKKKWNREVDAKYGLGQARAKQLQGSPLLVGVFQTPQCQGVPRPAFCSQIHWHLGSPTSFSEGRLTVDKATRAREALRHRDSRAYVTTSVVNSVKIRRSEKQYLVRNRWRKTSHFILITIAATTKLVLFILLVLKGPPVPWW